MFLISDQENFEVHRVKAGAEVTIGNLAKKSPPWFKLSKHL